MKNYKRIDEIAKLICDNIAAQDEDYAPWEECPDEGKSEWRKLAEEVIEVYEKHAN